MNQSPKIVVLTGAESTGKSTLTEKLAAHFDAPYVPEIARSYIENLNRKYTYSDVENIARLQIEQFNSFSKLDVPIVFFDTWLIITKVWFEVVFQKIPVWFIPEIKKSKIDLFLICNTDIPWVYDPVRENGGEMRNTLQKIYIHNISEFNFEHKIVEGLDEQRFQNALNFLKALSL